MIQYYYIALCVCSSQKCDFKKRPPSGGKKTDSAIIFYSRTENKKTLQSKPSLYAQKLNKDKHCQSILLRT